METICSVLQYSFRFNFFCYGSCMATKLSTDHLDAWRALLNAHASVVGAAEEALGRAGLPPLSWYDLLWALERAPERKRRFGELAGDLTISRGGLTKLADRLERAGLLARAPCETDGRGQYAVITSEGRALLRRMWPVYEAALRPHVEQLVSGEAATLADLLDRVRDGPLRAPRV
jgi:DNA-binding MarR family transcriptional regulator